MYSLSKALLNAFTRIVASQTPQTDTHQQTRIIAACPGNFLSPMSTVDEQQEVDAKLQMPDDAAADVWALAAHPNAFHSGNFYRHRQLIPW
jgi:hypothetical protein